jgi:uncharacterized cupredoxin-like copper-binding protein
MATVALGALFTAGIAGCGGTASAPDTQPAARQSSAPGGAPAATTVDVALAEWSVKPSVATAKAGEVTLVVTNKGAVAHEVAIVKADVAAEKWPQANAAVDEKTLPPLGRTASIDAGKSETKAFALQPGKYVLFCNVPAHYAQGMHAAFTVQ